MNLCDHLYNKNLSVKFSFLRYHDAWIRSQTKIFLQKVIRVDAIFYAREKYLLQILNILAYVAHTFIIQITAWVVMNYLISAFNLWDICCWYSANRAIIFDLAFKSSQFNFILQCFKNLRINMSSGCVKYSFTLNIYWNYFIFISVNGL